MKSPNSTIRIRTAGTTIKPTQAAAQIFNNGLTTCNTSNSTHISRQAVFLKTQVQKPKSIRNLTIENIEKSPQLYIGLSKERLNVLKNVTSRLTDITTMDLYVTLKKIRLNEDFNILSDCFELEDGEVQKVFSTTVVKLAKYMKSLIRWPDYKKYYDRHKNLPIAFRSRLSYVQSLVECIDTDFQPKTLHPHDIQLDSMYCDKLKFLLAMSPNGVISYISDMFATNQLSNDLSVFKASNFDRNIPTYLSLVAEPGKAIRQISCKHNSQIHLDEENADAKTEIVSQDPSSNTIFVQNGKLSSTSRDFTVPTIQLPSNVCRMQIRNLIYYLRDFKILQPYASIEPIVYQYFNEILVIIAGVINLQR